MDVAEEAVDVSRGTSRGASRLTMFAVAVVGLWISVALRVEIAGPSGSRSIRAGLVFAGCLAALTFAVSAPRWRWRPAQAVWGVGGAVVLCVPVLLTTLPSSTFPVALFPTWAAVVTVVAIAEELLLRGALFELLTPLVGSAGAMVVTAIAFALLHVPVYGWSVLAIDLAAGVVLGSLRVLADSVNAPIVAHVVADLAGWWLQ